MLDCSSQSFKFKLLGIKKRYDLVSFEGKHLGEQTLTINVTESSPLPSLHREIQEVPSCAGIREEFGLWLAWLPGVWAVVEAGETTGKKIKDLLGSSQILIKCFPGFTDRSKWTIKLANKFQKLGPESIRKGFRHHTGSAPKFLEYTTKEGQ